MPDPKLFTIGEAAARIATASRQKPEYIARQIRTLVQRGLVPPVARGSGQTSAAMLGEVGIAEARIHCWLFERGFAIPGGELPKEADPRHANEMNVFTAAHLALTCWTVPEGMSMQEHRKRVGDTPVALVQAIEGIRRGEQWALALTFYRNDQSGQRWVQASVFEQGEGYAKNKPDVRASFVPEGLQLIYLTPLLLPLVTDHSGMN